jgi:hypothetical protein
MAYSLELVLIFYWEHEEIVSIAGAGASAVVAGTQPEPEIHRVDP